MSTLNSAAQELGIAAASLLSEIRNTGDPPTRRQMQAVQTAIDRVQRQLNCLQTEADMWSDVREAG